MRTRSHSILIAAAPGEVFDLLHDYGRRLEWDPFLRRAELLDGATSAGVGVEARCTARWRSGGLGMDVVYVSFKPPTVAAITMTRGPWPIRSFAASLRQVPAGDGLTRVTYKFHFTVRPAWAAPLLRPAFARFFAGETRRRLEHLKTFLEARPQPAAIAGVS